MSGSRQPRKSGSRDLEPNDPSRKCRQVPAPHLAREKPINGEDGEKTKAAAFKWPRRGTGEGNLALGNELAEHP